MFAGHRRAAPRGGACAGPAAGAAERCLIPNPYPCAQAIGELTPAAADALGLPPGLLVAPGSGDNQMSALGAGAVAEGAFVASLGTSGTLFGASGSPVVDPSGGIAPFCDATGQWLPLLCTMNCTLVPEEARAALMAVQPWPPNLEQLLCRPSATQPVWLPLLCTMSCTLVPEEARSCGAVPPTQDPLSLDMTR